MNSDIRRSALNAVFWSMVDSTVRVGLQFGITVALARLVTPEEFGIVALISVFAAIASVFTDSGFGAAIIQQREISDDEISAIFHFQWTTALVLGLGLCFCSSWIARFYDYPVLQPLIWLMAFNIVVSSLGSVQQSRLSRALNFRPSAIAGLLSTIISGLLAVLLAMQSAGVWALATQTVTASVINVVTLWILCPWRPQLVFRPMLLKKSFRFGKYLFLSSLLDVMYGRLYALFVGKLFGAAELGQYNRANATQGMPMGLLSGIVMRVAYPTFAALQHDKRQLRAALRRALTGAMAINVPVMVGLIAVADTLVPVLFGQAWLPSIPVLRVLCLSGLLWPPYVINLQALIAQGESRLFFRLEMIKKAVGIIVFLAAVPFGIVALAWSATAAVLIWFVMHAYYSRRMLGYGVLEQVTDCSPWLVAGVLMGLMVWIVPHGWALTMSITLILQIVVGTVVYLMFWLVWDASLLRDILSVTPGATLVRNRLTAVSSALWKVRN
jgi:teichuronic acid exporter